LKKQIFEKVENTNNTLDKELTSKLFISYQFFITLKKAKEGQHRIGLKEKRFMLPSQE